MLKKLKISNGGVPDFNSPHIISSQTLPGGVLISLWNSPEFAAAFEQDIDCDKMGNDR